MSSLLARALSPAGEGRAGAMLIPERAHAAPPHYGSEFFVRGSAWPIAPKLLQRHPDATTIHEHALRRVDFSHDGWLGCGSRAVSRNASHSSTRRRALEPD